MSAPYRVLVVDDERPARSKLARLLDADPRVLRVGEAHDGLAALAAIDRHAPDILLLDVELPDLDGFEVVDAIPPERELAIIFVTAYDEYALRAFEAHAIDYLLKPYDAARLAKALDKGIAQLAGRRAAGHATPAEPTPRRRRIALRTDGGWIVVAAEDIRHCVAADKHVWVRTASERILVRSSLSALLARLDGDAFVRTHRSEAVRLAAITRIEPSSHGDAVMTLIDGSCAVLSRTHRAAVLEKLGCSTGVTVREFDC